MTTSNTFENSIRRGFVPRLTVLAIPLAVATACAYSLSEGDDQRYVSPAREIAKGALEDPLLEEVMAKIPASAINHNSDPRELSDDSGEDILKRLRATDLEFSVQCRRTANLKTWAWEGVATDGQRTISLRCAWFDRQSVTEWSGTLVHELAHHAGYLHDGNARAGNECTVPHLIADAIVHIASLRKGEGAEVDSDVCSALKQAIAVATGA